MINYKIISKRIGNDPYGIEKQAYQILENKLVDMIKGKLAISSVNYSLPFSLSGDLLDQENVNLNIFKKYKSEHLLLYLTE